MPAPAPSTPAASPPAPVVATPQPPEAKQKPPVAKKKPLVQKAKPDHPAPRHPTPTYEEDGGPIYEDGPVPPWVIGRHHVYVETERDYDGNYVIIRRVHRCQPWFSPGVWLLHRAPRCY